MREEILILEIASHLEILVAAAKEMARRHKVQQGTELELQIRLAYGGAMLFRSLNLAECMIWAARAGHGETVAIVARVIGEMLYNVAHAGPDLKGLVDFAIRGAEERKKWIEKVLEASPGSEKSKDLKDMARLLQDCLEGQDCNWERQVRSRAKSANMDDSYVNEYLMYSEQVHTSSSALDGYISGEAGRLIVNTKIREVLTKLYLVFGVAQWVELVRRLFAGLPLQESEEFLRAHDGYAKFIDALPKRKDPSSGESHATET